MLYIQVSTKMYYWYKKKYGWIPQNTMSIKYKNGEHKNTNYSYVALYLFTIFQRYQYIYQCVYILMDKYVYSHTYVSIIFQINYRILNMFIEVVKLLKIGLSGKLRTSLPFCPCETTFSLPWSNFITKIFGF